MSRAYATLRIDWAKLLCELARRGLGTDALKSDGISPSTLSDIKAGRPVRLNPTVRRIRRTLERHPLVDVMDRILA